MIAWQEAEIAIKRATLVVRLHRMVQAGKLTSRTHGHYVLSEAEHNRRQLGLMRARATDIAVAHPLRRNT